MDDPFGQSDSDLLSAAKRSRLGWGQGLRRKAPSTNELGPSDAQGGELALQGGEAAPAETPRGEAAADEPGASLSGGEAAAAALSAPPSEAAASPPPLLADEAARPAANDEPKPLEVKVEPMDEAGQGDPPPKEAEGAAAAAAAEFDRMEVSPRGGDGADAATEPASAAAAAAEAAAGDGEATPAQSSPSPAPAPAEEDSKQPQDPMYALTERFRRAAETLLSESVRRCLSRGVAEAGLPTKDEVVQAIGRLDADIDRIEGIVRRIESADGAPVPIKLEGGADEPAEAAGPEPAAPPPPLPPPPPRRPRRDPQEIAAEIVEQNRSLAAAAHASLSALPDPRLADPEATAARIAAIGPEDPERRRRFMAVLSARAGEAYDADLRLLRSCVNAYVDFGARIRRYEAEQRVEDRKRKEFELRNLEREQSPYPDHLDAPGPLLCHAPAPARPDHESRVADPVAEAEARKLVLPWSAEEEQLFVEHFLNFPKDCPSSASCPKDALSAPSFLPRPHPRPAPPRRLPPPRAPRPFALRLIQESPRPAAQFVKISSLLQGSGHPRSVQDCVQCYYRIKMREKLKQRVKAAEARRQKPKFRGNPNRELLSLGVEDVKHVIEEGGSRQARRVAEAAKRRADATAHSSGAFPSSSSSWYPTSPAPPLPAAPPLPPAPPLPAALPLPPALAPAGSGSGEVPRSKMSVSSMLN
eukprot:tig00020629_g12417.t1